MNEPQSELHPNTKAGRYDSLLFSIEKNPFSDIAWEQAVAIAREEEKTGAGIPSYYSQFPLDALIAFGERLRVSPEGEGRYRLLSEEAPNGQLWYDVVLGRVNQKVFQPIEDEIRYRSYVQGKHLKRGLDVGIGLGNTLRPIAPFFDELIGVDQHTFLLDHLREKGVPRNTTLLVGDAVTLPDEIQEVSIDIVFSNAMTYYLQPEEVKRFIGQIARVLRPGGSYFEGFAIHEENQPLPKIESEYLTSAKAMLVLLLDRIASYQKNPGGLPMGEILHEFERYGFGYSSSEVNEDDVFYVEFQK